MKWICLLPILLLFLPLAHASDVDVSVDVTPARPVEYSLISIGIASSCIMLTLVALGYEFKSISDIVSLYVTIILGIILIGVALRYFV